MEIHPERLPSNLTSSRGHGRDRTAVKGFADPCLTTRPHDHTRFQAAIIMFNYKSTKLVDYIYYAL